MAITQTQTESKGVSNLAVGRYITTGTAAAIVITLGYTPRYVDVQNLNSSGFVRIQWYEGMAAASAIKTAKAGDRSLITTLGITVSETGFTIGFDTDLLVTSEQLSWKAQR